MRRWFVNWVCGWADLVCGLICVVTFTLWRPWWDFKIRCWFDTNLLKRSLEEEM